MYGCESWTVKKAEHQRIDAFELWCWRRLLRVPWTARRFNQSILKETSPGISLEGMMLKLKLQYFGHLMWRVTHWKRLWCWEGLGAGGEGDNRGQDGWMASLTRWTWVWVNSGSWWWTGGPGVLRWRSKESDTTEQLNWSELNWTTWIGHRDTYLPWSWTPSHLPSHFIRLRCPRARTLGALLHASNSHWSSVLDMVMYMFQCYSLKSSHPLLPPRSPKVCSLHLCLLCCPAGRIIHTIF